MQNKTKGTFLDETKNPPLNQSQIAMIGIGFDLTASYGKGTKLGPKAIIEASRQIEFEPVLSSTPLDKKTKIHNLGLLEFDYKKKMTPQQTQKETNKMIQKAKKKLEKAIELKKFLMIFGGDHSTTNATLLAITKKINPNKICWLRFDAHLDLRNALEGNPLSHGSIGRRIYDKGCRQIFIGIRDQISQEEQKFITKNRLADDIFYCATQPKKYYNKNQTWIKKENISFNSKLTKTQIQKILSKTNKPRLFINIDIDCLDANEFNGTGTPMPNGLNWQTLNEILFEIITHAKKNNSKISGFDIVEVFPLLKNYNKTYSIENAQNTQNEMKAALLAYNIINWNFMKK